MSGLLTPDARLRVFSDLGLVAPGARLHTYVSGTPSTPLATYSDDALTVPNTNPVVASAGGLFGPIYLTPGRAYKYVLADTNDVQIWTQDPVTAEGFDAATFTNHGVLIGTGSAAVHSTAAGAAGLVLTGTGATTDPTFQASGSNGVNDFRITARTGVPVTTDDVLAATSLYCSPTGRGNRLGLFDAVGAPTVYSSAEFSIPVPATLNTNYDVFAYANAGVPTLELLAWRNSGQAITGATNATPIVITANAHTMVTGDEVYVSGVKGNTAANGTWIVANATANTVELVGSIGNGAYTATSGYLNARTAAGLLVTTTTGVYTKTADLTRRFLATCRTTGVAGQIEDSFAKRYVWNHYNRVKRVGRVLETTDSWPYTLAAYQQANAAAANQLDFVVGIQDQVLHVEVHAAAINSSNVAAQVSIGLDSATIPAANVMGIAGTPFSAPVAGALLATLDVYVAPGRHFLAWLERSTATGTTTWYGDNGDATLLQAGIVGWLEG